MSTGGTGTAQLICALIIPVGQYFCRICFTAFDANYFIKMITVLASKVPRVYQPLKICWRLDNRLVRKLGRESLKFRVKNDEKVSLERVSEKSYI